MNDTVLNIIIGLSAAIIGVLAFAGEIGKSKTFRILKSLTFKIIIFIIATLLGILATVKKDSNSDLQRQNDKAEFQKEQSKRDSSNNEKIDSMNLKTIQLLAIYGFKIDSAKNSIEKRINSSNNENLPLVYICDGPLQYLYRNEDTLKVVLNICCNQATAYHFHLGFRAIAKKDGEYYLWGHDENIFPTDFSVSTKGASTFIQLKGRKQLEIDSVFMVFHGSYNTYYKTMKPSPIINEVCLFDLKNKNIAHWDYKYDINLYAFLRQHNLE